jgi:hypothetical protein
MNKKKPAGGEIDELLKRVLTDDLPPESEERMKKRINQFRDAIDQLDLQRSRNTGIIWSRLFRPLSWRWTSWVFRKETLAFSALVLVAVGGLRHLSGQPSALAESVSLLHTLVSISDEVRHTSSMECTVRMPVDSGRSLVYSIHWLSPDLARVDIQKADEVDKTLWVSGEEVTIADHATNELVRVKSLGQIRDSVFGPILDFLSPNNLSDLIYAGWQPKERKQTGPEGTTFTFMNNDEEAALLEMTVNLNSDLPVRLRKFLTNPWKEAGTQRLVLRIDFVWNRPVSPQFMIPGIAHKSTSA